MKNLLSQLL